MYELKIEVYSSREYSMTAHPRFFLMVTSKRVRSVTSYALVVFLCFIMQGNLGCSFQACSKKVTSESEARSAVSAFFSSESAAAQKLIAYLRKDGLEDEYLENLKNGCRGCYIEKGNESYNRNAWYATNRNAWYATALIAPKEKKRTIVFEIECADSILLNHTLYGG
jgi:hypothetical protein